MVTGDVIFVIVFITLIIYALLTTIISICIIVRLVKTNRRYKRLKNEIDKDQKNILKMISDMAATREKNTEYTENKTLITLTDEIQNREGNIYEYAYGESSSYEEISEKSSLFSNLKDYVYGYVPFVNKKPSSTDNNQKNLNTVSRKSLGSRDHLKFFRIFSRTDPENDREQSYLEPKKYYPEENCPVELKSLGETQRDHK